MVAFRQKLTLDRPAIYEIMVPGELDKSWTDWDGRMTVSVQSEGDGPPVTTLTGAVDQAALHSMLRRLYSLGLPLISVNCVECGSEDEPLMRWFRNKGMNLINKTKPCNEGGTTNGWQVLDNRSDGFGGIAGGV